MRNSFMSLLSINLTENDINAAERCNNIGR